MPTVNDLLGPPKVDDLLGAPPVWTPDVIAQHAGPGRVTSAGRDPATNARVGGSPTSSHLQRAAYDWAPADGDTAAAARKLAAAGLPYDQIIDEGSHVHLGYGPKNRGQVLGKGRPAPTPGVDDYLGPPSVDDLLGPAPAKPAAQARAAVKPVAPVAVPPSLLDKAIQYGKEELQSGVVEPAKRLYSDLTDKKFAKLKKPIERNPIKAIAGQFKEDLDTGVDAFNLAMSPASTAAHAALQRPYGAAMSKLTGGKYSAEQASADMGTALMAGKPGKGASIARPAAPLMETPAPVLKVPKPVTRATPLPEVVPATDKAPARVRTLAAAKEDLAVPELVQEDIGGPVVGDEKAPVERVDNALNRLAGHATADKLEAKQFIEANRDIVKNDALQEELTHAIEAGAPLSPELQAAEDLRSSWRDRQLEAINRLREIGDPAAEPYTEGMNHVPRRVEGYTPILDNVPGQQARDPILGRGTTLTKTAQAQKQRTAGYMVTDADGATHFTTEVHPTDIMDRPYQSVRQATVKEIEANTDTRYHKNATLNTIDDTLRLERVLRNREVLDELTDGLKQEGLAHREYWFRKNEAGETVKQVSNGGRAPDHFVSMPQIPQLEGMKFDPKVANVLRDVYGSADPHGSALGDGMAKLNRALTASLFITPVPHAANVMAHWAVGRGWDWITLPGMRGLMKTGSKAAVEVLTGGPKYREMLRQGSGLLYGDTQTADFHKLMAQKASREITADPSALKTFAQAAKLPVDVVKGAYRLSNKALWAANDIFLLQRQLELEKKGMSTRMAIREAERDIPNYRVPPEVLGSRKASQWLRDPNVMMFGRYKYGQMRAWGTMFHDLYKGDLATKKDALGKFVAAMVIANVVYPYMDKGLQALTGNKEATVKRSGGFSLTDTASKVAKGDKSISVGLASFMSPAPVVAKGMEVYGNNDFFGRPIRTEGAPPWMQGAELAAYVAKNAAYPVGLGVEAIQPDGGAASAAGKLLGVELPPEGKEARAKKFKAKGKAHGAKDAARFKNRLKEGKYADAAKKMGRR